MQVDVVVVGLEQADCVVGDHSVHFLVGLSSPCTEGIHEVIGLFFGLGAKVVQ